MKYYKPEINEFFIGFIYEASREATNPINYDSIIIERGSQIDDVGMYEDYRVKYLDQEDIEACGWKYMTKTQVLWFKKEGSFKTPGERHPISKYMLSYDINTHELHILCYFGGQEEGTLFEGIIKNKSELLKLMNQLKIEI